MAKENDQDVAAENAELKKQLKTRDDEVGSLQRRLKSLEKDFEALKVKAGIKEEESIPVVTLSVKNRKTDKVEKKKVTVNIPRIRYEGEVVSSLAFMKVAAGKKLSKEEQALNPALDELPKEKAIAKLTKWVAMRVGILNIS